MYLTVWNLLDPDCYKLVSRNRDVKTTTVLPDERTTTSKPKHGYKHHIFSSIFLFPINKCTQCMKDQVLNIYHI